MTSYNKFWIALIGAVVTYLVQHYGKSNVVQDVVASVTALGVYATPNQ